MPMTTDRQIEAQSTKQAAQADSHMSVFSERQLIGTTDWYVCITNRGLTKVLRERDIPADEKVVGTVAGPYYTKDQARCESHGYRGKDNSHDYVHHFYDANGKEVK